MKAKAILRRLARGQTPARVAPPREPPSILITRTERRSWIAIAITGFGALLLRYFRSVRERAKIVRKP